VYENLCYANKINRNKTLHNDETVSEHHGLHAELHSENWFSIYRNRKHEITWSLLIRGKQPQSYILVTHTAGLFSKY